LGAQRFGLGLPVRITPRGQFRLGNNFAANGHSWPDHCGKNRWAECGFFYCCGAGLIGGRIDKNLGLAFGHFRSIGFSLSAQWKDQVYDNFQKGIGQ